MPAAPVIVCMIIKMKRCVREGTSFQNTQICLEKSLKQTNVDTQLLITLLLEWPLFYKLNLIF